MKKLALHWQVIIALIIGLIYSYVSVYTNSDAFPINAFTKDFITPFGKIFINLLKMIAVPLVLFSIISGIVNLKDVKKLGRIGRKTLLIYVGTTMLAVTIGLLVVNVWKPGEKVGAETRLEKRVEYEVWLSESKDVKRLDDIHEMDKPENLALVQKITSDSTFGQISDDVEAKLVAAKENKAKGPLQPLVDIFPDNIFSALSNMKM